MNFMGILGSAMKGGGAEAADYLQEEQKAQRQAALEAQRAANEEARALRLEEIRVAREEATYKRRREDAKLDEAAAFDRSVDPERIFRQAEADKIKRDLGPRAPINLPAGGQLRDPYTYDVIADNPNKLRSTNEEKLPPLTKRTLDRLDRADDKADSEAAEIRKAMREAADPATKKSLEGELAGIAQRKKDNETKRYKEIVKHDPEVYLDRDVDAIRRGVKTVDEFKQRLQEVQQMTGSKAYADRIGRELVEGGFIQELEQREKESKGVVPPPGSTYSGSETRASAAAGIPPVPPPPPKPQGRAFYGDTSVYASRDPARPRPPVFPQETAVDAAPPPPAPIARAAEPQVTGDPSTGLMGPAPVAAAAPTRLDQRAPGVDISSGDWNQISASVRAREGGAHSDRLAILESEMANPNLSPDARAALRTEIAAVTSTKDWRGQTKWNAPVIDAANQTVDLLNPQNPAGIPATAGVDPQTPAPFKVTPAQAKKELAARGGAVGDEEFAVLRAGAARGEPRATVTETRAQKMMTYRAEAQSISPSTIAEMTPAEAKEKIARLAPVLTPVQYRALWMRSRG